MSENQKRLKTKIKHFIPYALGEIVLVAIGILIAVWLNNWNTKNENIEKAREHLNKVKVELITDTITLSNAINFIEQNVFTKKLLLKSNRIDTLPLKYLEFGINTQYMNIKINDASFSGMKDPMVLTLPEFHEVFVKVNHYYTFYQDYLTNFSEWERSLATKESEFWDQQGDFEISLLAYTEDSIPIFQDSTDRSNKMITKINSTKGRNFFKLSLHRFKTIKRSYIKTKNQAEELLDYINKYESK